MVDDMYIALNSNNSLFTITLKNKILIFPVDDYNPNKVIVRNI